MKLTLVVGLPGSGKTYFATSLGGTLIDDISINTADKTQITGDHLVVTDPNACQVDPATVLRKLTEWFGEREISVFAFENDVDACMKNISARADSRVITKQTMHALAKNYRPEEWGTVVPVFKTD